MVRVKKANKKGITLVLVLFILAMGMIFISCALFLVQNTRMRLYNQTYDQQVRLTLTSAVESFYQALQIQEIPDSSLESLANKKAQIKIVMDKNPIPGVKGEADSNTTASFDKDNIDGKEVVKIIFTTTLTDKTESALVYLKKSDSPDTPDLFASQVDFNGPLGNNFRGSIGRGAPAGTTDNIVVWRGKYRSNQSQSTITYSDMIFLGKPGATGQEAFFENNEVMYGDVFFLDNYTLSFNSTAVSFNGDVYFLGAKGTGNAFTGNDSASRSYAKAGTTWSFINRKANVSQTAGNVMGAIQNGDCLFLNKPSGTWTTSLASALSGTSQYTNKMAAWKTKNNSGEKDDQKAKATSYFTDDPSSIVQDYPTSSQLKNKYNIPISVSDCEGYTETTFKDIITAQNALNSAGASSCLDSGNYLIQGDQAYVGKQVSGGAYPYVVFLDGQKDYMFFINESVYLEGVIFAVVNPNPAKHQFFILAPGKKLTLNSVNSGNTGRVACGFMSVTREGSGNPTQYYSKIGTLTTFKCDQAYDGVKKPTIHIYCIDQNEIEMTRGTVVEAYLGMFQSNYNSSTSKLTVTNGSNDYHPNFCFYGRIMATSIINQSGDFDVPYCPAPNKANTAAYAEQTSAYSVYGLQYYI